MISFGNPTKQELKAEKLRSDMEDDMRAEYMDMEDDWRAEY